MQGLKVQCLDAAQLADAYPLIRSATRVSQQRWEEFGRELVAGGGGVLAVFAPDGCVHGVAAFQPVPNLRHEHSLDVHVLVAFALGGNDHVREHLLSALEGIAATHRCRSVNFTMAAGSYGEPSSPPRAALERLGLKLETVNFVREIDWCDDQP